MKKIRRPHLLCAVSVQPMLTPLATSGCAAWCFRLAALRGKADRGA